MACKTVAIPEPHKHATPPGITLPEVKKTILTALSTLTPQKPSGVIFDEILNFEGISHTWVLEKVESGKIRATTRQKGRHYLTANIHYTQQEWWIEIAEAKNIDYDGERIHKNALIWLGYLEGRIQQYFDAYEVDIEKL